MTATQKAILAAIEAGHTTTRAIAQAAGLVSNSDITRQLQQLAALGHVVLRETPRGLTVDTSGASYCAGWDSACRLMGNREA